MAEQHPVALDPRPLSARLWTWQRIRFPLATQGALTVLFALACVCFGSLTRRSPAPPTTETVIIAIVVVFLLFFQLRVADEHRDYEEDWRTRRWLPVPKGVITLPELDVFAWGAAAIQIVLTAALHPPLVALLLGPWLWIFLVRHDFFMPETLSRRPILSLFIHLLFFPFVALFAAGADQLPMADALSGALAPFLLMTALAAAALEFARKCRAPAAEQPGVITYSALWGPTRAGMVAAFVVAASILAALMAFVAAGAPGLWFVPAAAIGFVAFLAAARYVQAPTAPRSLALLGATALWTAAAYASVGLLPFALRHAGATAS